MKTKLETKTNASKPHLGGNIKGGDPRSFMPSLWDWLISKFHIKSVLDVGCGEGHALLYFKKLGCEVNGIDGLKENVDCCNDMAKVVDLTERDYIFPVDMVWCCELVEHVDKKNIDNVINTLCNGRVVAMTHGRPKQKGYHHVNCQPANYWIKHITDRGYKFLAEETKLSKELKNTWTTGYWYKSGLIFERLSK